jgi:hypothetical protein
MGRRVSDPVVLFGTATVAEKLCVTRGAVSNWLNRYKSWPPPYAEVRQPSGTVLFLWTADQIELDWPAWYEGGTFTD